MLNAKAFKVPYGTDNPPERFESSQRRKLRHTVDTHPVSAVYDILKCCRGELHKTEAFNF